MTLRPTGPFTEGVNTGVILALYAGDPRYDFEIQRAPDVAGVPGTYTTIAAELPGGTELFTDRLPLDSAPRWYRIRHTGFGDTPSSYIGPVSAVPGVLPLFVSRPPLGAQLTMRLLRHSVSGGQIVVRAYVADPEVTDGTPIIITASQDGVDAVLPGSATLVSPTDTITSDLETTAYAEFIITQPAADQPQGRVSLCATRFGRRPAVQSIDVSPRGQYLIPDPIIGPLAAEGTAHGGDREGMVHIPLTFDINTFEFRVFTAENAAAGIAAPDLSNASLSAVIRRQEGEDESADNWTTMHDVATTEDYYRRVVVLPVGPTGFQREPYSAEIQAVDTGTGPTSDPTSLVVTMSTVTGFARASLAWTCTDAAAFTRVKRNGVIVAIMNPTDAAFIDDGLAPGIDYVYEIDHYRNGQTSGQPSSGPTPSGTPTLVAPTWTSGFPYGSTWYGQDLDHSSDLYQVYFSFTNPDPLARTLVYSNTSTSNTGPFGTLVADLDPGVASCVANGPAGTIRWFLLVSQRPGGYTTSPDSAHASATYGG